MKMLYISQPFEGRTEEDIFEERAKILDYVEKLFLDTNKFFVIDQYHHLTPPDGTDQLWYLTQRIRMMDAAHLIVFTPNWETSKECVIEHRIAELYDLTRLEGKEINEWISR